ncbi:hypothetical protein CRG98_023133 [Punica granatum]|uniref:Uncharacterized protein n=1 Tax=Punica granatum TaxID=22663 RepID=A0A2I0JJN9_PUNGR|nr:hypothetical protein CRG98_023133 [Punica granatum]
MQWTKPETTGEHKEIVKIARKPRKERKGARVASMAGVAGEIERKKKKKERTGVGRGGVCLEAVKKDEEEEEKIGTLTSRVGCRLGQYQGRRKEEKEGK